MADSKLTVAGILYPGFEMLDLFGPLEMYSLLGTEQVEIVLLAEHDQPVPSAMGQDISSGPKAMPDCVFSAAPKLDLVVLPGGFGTIPQLANEVLLEFLRQQAETAQIVSSICTGSVLLARAGLLDGRRATTNKQFFALGTNEAANVEWVEAARWVEDDKFFTSSGVSAGIDMTLAVISRLFGVETAEQVAVGAEYTWHRDADEDPFVEHLNGMSISG